MASVDDEAWSFSKRVSQGLWLLNSLHRHIHLEKMLQFSVPLPAAFLKHTLSFFLANLVWCIIGVSVSIIALKLIYNLLFHPLSNFKGPWYLAGSDLVYAYLQLRGTSQYVLKRAHDQYGDVVRIAPNTLSFIDSKAWDEIYGYRKGTAALPKDPLFYNEMLLPSNTITLASDVDAVPIRRAMNSAFSARNLLEQAPMLAEHLDSLVGQLDRSSRQNEDHVVDVRNWYTMSMFDINSDFGFGEDMGCVKKGEFHEWVQFVLDCFFAATLLHQCHKFWPLAQLLAALMPKSIQESQKRHSEASLQRVHRRMQKEDLGRPDFMHHFVRSAQKEGLSTDVIEAQASVVILAGSETSATALTSATYQTLTHPEVYQKLCDEVRSTFDSPADINLPETLHKLPYLEAVVWEAMRIHSPLANGFTRVVPAYQEDFMICGRHIPPSTVVTMNHHCCNMSAANFLDPERFVPERWLGDVKYKSDQREVTQPFSVGPRNCPGRNFALNNIKLGMVYMIMNFDMELGKRMERWGDSQQIYNGWRQPPLSVSLWKRA